MSQHQNAVVDQKNHHEIQHQDDRVWLENVPHEELVYSWDCSLRGIHLILQDRGVDISFDQLVALSGDAFFICFADAPDTFPELVMPTDPLVNVANALGYESRWLITDSKYRAHLNKSEPDIEKRRAMTQQVVDQICEQVDRGRPPLVAGASQIGCGNWSLVVGYDKANKQFCHNGLHKEPAYSWHNIRGISYALNDVDGEFGYWNGRPRGTVLPGFEGGWLVNPVFILGDQTSTPDQTQVALITLKRAVELYHAKPIHFFGGMHYFGDRAYQQWINAINTMDDPKDLVLDQVVRGRHAAAAYCRSIKTLFPQSTNQLDMAADAYDKLVKIAHDAFADLIPFDWENPKREKWGTQEQRTTQRQALMQMRDMERIAIEAIRSVVMQANVVRDGDKVWIKGVDGFSTSKWVDSVHGSQARILESMSHTMNYEDLIGYSGFAFRVGIHEAFCPSAGHPCCGYMCLDNGNKALPWTFKFYDSMPWSKPKDDRAAFEAEVCAAIKQSIDAGIPVHYGGEEDGLIIGYADKGKRWWCVHPYYKDGKEAFWHDKVEPRGVQSFAGPNWPWMVSVWQKPKPVDEQLTTRQATINALKQAVDMWHHQVDANVPDRPRHVYFSGAQAYDHWINWLDDVQAGKVEKPDAGMMGNAWCFCVLVHSRNIAAKWLKRQAQDFDGKAREQMLNAAKAYAQIPEVCLKDINSTWDIALPPDRFNDWTPVMRQMQIKRLKASRQCDLDAIVAIQNALTALEREKQ